MDDAMARSNLQISSRVELKDPNGDVWTVALKRPGEPDQVSPFFPSFDVWEVTLRRIVRFLRRDRRWEVRVYRGSHEWPVRQVEASDRSQAMVEALAICESIGSRGTPMGG